MLNSALFGTYTLSFFLSYVFLSLFPSLSPDMRLLISLSLSSHTSSLLRSFFSTVTFSHPSSMFSSSTPPLLFFFLPHSFPSFLTNPVWIMSTSSLHFFLGLAINSKWSFWWAAFGLDCCCCVCVCACPCVWAAQPNLSKCSQSLVHCPHVHIPLITFQF